MSDYIPQNDDELRAWIVNFVAKLGTYGAAVGITAPQQAQLTSLGNSTKGSIDNLSTKKTDYDAALMNRTEQTVAEFEFEHESVTAHRRLSLVESPCVLDDDGPALPHEFDHITGGKTRRNVAIGKSGIPL